MSDLKLWAEMFWIHVEKRSRERQRERKKGRSK
jgi:hypothetical protein